MTRSVLVLALLSLLAGIALELCTSCKTVEIPLQLPADLPFPTINKTTTTSIPPADKPVTCSCGERVDFLGAKERGNIISLGGQADVRGIINDHNGRGQWLTAAQLRDSVTISGKTLSARCVKLANGVMAHNLGWKQPKSAGPLQAPVYPATIASGTLRLYYESRAAK